jgi:hypothetical protein
MVLEELLFFVVVPICALLTYETVRIMQRRRLAVVTADGERRTTAKVGG